jgi:hypothetical protein
MVNVTFAEKPSAPSAFLSSSPKFAILSEAYVIVLF